MNYISHHQNKVGIHENQMDIWTDGNDKRKLLETFHHISYCNIWSFQCRRKMWYLLHMPLSFDSSIHYQTQSQGAKLCLLFSGLTEHDS